MVEDVLLRDFVVVVLIVPAEAPVAYLADDDCDSDARVDVNPELQRPAMS